MSLASKIYWSCLRPVFCDTDQNVVEQVNETCTVRVVPANHQRTGDTPYIWRHAGQADASTSLTVWKPHLRIVLSTPVPDHDPPRRVGTPRSFITEAILCDETTPARTISRMLAIIFVA